MIITIFLTVIFAILWPIVQLIALLPDVSNISTIGTAITTASQYLTGLNSFLPVTTLLAIFSAFLIYETAYFSFKIIYWVIKRIPTQS
jgi:hypothetical protein